MTKQEEGKLRSKFARRPPSWIWVFQVSRPPQLLRASLTLVYTEQDHVQESLKMAFFVVILDLKYPKMTPKFVKQKSHWLHSSIKFATLLKLIPNKSFPHPEAPLFFLISYFFCTWYLIYYLLFPQVQIHCQGSMVASFYVNFGVNFPDYRLHFVLWWRGLWWLQTCSFGEFNNSEWILFW